jgi:hypothetical protein
MYRSVLLHRDFETLEGKLRSLMFPCSLGKALDVSSHVVARLQRFLTSLLGFLFHLVQPHTLFTRIVDCNISHALSFLLKKMAPKHNISICELGLETG